MVEMELEDLLILGILEWLILIMEERYFQEIELFQLLHSL